MRECRCEPNRGHAYSGCCCCRDDHHGFGHFARRLMTKAEKIEKLEKYAQELRNELAAVQEHVKGLKDIE